MRPRGGRSVLRALVSAIAWSCRWDNSPGPGLCMPPQVVASEVRANATNVLSAIVVARVQSADSVVVRFGRSNGALDSTSAAVDIAATEALTPDSVVVPVLGLEPHTDYAVQLVAYADCGVASGTLLAFRSGALPGDLPAYVARGSNPTPGFVAFSAGPYGVVIDNTGRVVWYRRFPNGPGLNFQPQPTGRYAARPPTPPGEIGSWVEVDVTGSIVSSVTCARGLQPRLHDLISLPDGSHWLMCDETRSMDLSAHGGIANAQVTGTVIQHLRADGAVLFEWSAFEHFALTELDSLDRLGASVNWTHGNAIDLDLDGNIVASFRSLSEITKIDAVTGAIVWRLGGRANQFTFAADAAPFARQHGVRVLSTGALQLLDNLGVPLASRAMRVAYRRDVAMRAWQTATYAPQPAVVALLGGSTQELPNGHVLVSYGNGNRVEEYDDAGNVAWRIEGNPGYVFRATRIRSLYRPGIGYHR